MSRANRLTRCPCDECKRVQLIPTPTIDVVYMPDELAHVWWTCGECGTVDHRPIRPEWQHDIVRRLEAGGATIRDWSELDQHIQWMPTDQATADHLAGLLEADNSFVLQSIMSAAAQEILRQHHLAGGDQ